ncbi:hypothetical protein GCM10009809_12400 [Isoptericola hypogeus]|uniref:Cytosolic endo-beta-N-acetylglucosaminidase TIM barrel domain-containing protein n=1 Tax=Isoptericola hypogeus TaxID=300179 RepID=A0ABN2J4U3_9MICO
MSSTDLTPGPSRRTVLTVGGLGLGALLAGVSPAVAFADATGAADAGFPVPDSAGIPPGPAPFGWNPTDLLEFDPATHPWARHLRCLVPRAERIEPFAPTQAHPDLDPAVQLSTLTRYYSGATYGVRPQPIGLEPWAYTQRYWQYIDVWGTWHGIVSHLTPDELVSQPSGTPGRIGAVIDLPDPQWVEAAHLNGAKAIGGWFWPRGGVDFDGFLVRREDGSFPVGDKLVEIRRYFGFDGLFINQEARITADQVARLKALFAYVKRIDPDFYLQYYDAVLPDSGSLSYQNELNDRNAPWLGTPDEPIMDSIFINYGWYSWQDPDLSTSRATAERHGFDPRQVAFAGIEHQKGVFNPSERFGAVAGPGVPAPVSVGLFVDNTFWWTKSRDGEAATVEGRAGLRAVEQHFWSGPTGDPSTSGRRVPFSSGRQDIWNHDRFDGIAHWISERSPFGELPVVSSFNIGSGAAFWLDGEQVGDRGWNNQGCADRALSWQFWTEGDLSVELDETVAYEGGHSLAVSGAGVLHLFKTDLTADGRMRAQVVAQGLESAELGITWRDAPDDVDWHPLDAERGDTWDVWGTSVAVRGRRVARVSLRVRGEGRLGKVALLPQLPGRRPERVTGLSVTDAGDWKALPGTRHLALEWSLSEGADLYDVLQHGDAGATWLGRVRRDAFFAESVDLGRGRTFSVRPTGADGRRGAPAVATLR